jgi:sulfhydrogenase subunit gamma (sulfur reductase)
MSRTANPYVPYKVRIEKVTVENDERDLKTFRLAFCDPSDGAAFSHRCGQFAMLHVPGAGEIPIGIASSPLDKGYVEFTVKRYPTGSVTTALHDLSDGDTIGLRGPLGNGFPLDALKGKNLLVVGGGFAFTTLRAAIRYLLHDSVRKDYGDITIIYGARSPGELLYKQELAEWQKRSDVQTHITVDKGDASWKGREGFVPAVVSQVAPSPANAHCIVCGPPIMLKFTMPPLLTLGFAPEAIITSQERRMSCGIGKCGRCNIGPKYVCKDGPVFTYAQMMEMEKRGE